MFLKSIFFCVFVFYSNVNGLIIPSDNFDVLQTLQALLPQVLAGIDTRIGIGYKFGRFADFQIIAELGPQNRTRLLGTTPPTPPTATPSIPFNIGPSIGPSIGSTANTTNGTSASMGNIDRNAFAFEAQSTGNGKSNAFNLQSQSIDDILSNMDKPPLNQDSNNPSNDHIIFMDELKPKSDFQMDNMTAIGNSQSSQLVKMGADQPTFIDARSSIDTLAAMNIVPGTQMSEMETVGSENVKTPMNGLLLPQDLLSMINSKNVTDGQSVMDKSDKINMNDLLNMINAYQKSQMESEKGQTKSQMMGDEIKTDSGALDATNNTSDSDQGISIELDDNITNQPTRLNMVNNNENMIPNKIENMSIQDLMSMINSNNLTDGQSVMDKSDKINMNDLLNMINAYQMESEKGQTKNQMMGDEIRTDSGAQLSQMDATNNTSDSDQGISIELDDNMTTEPATPDIVNNNDGTKVDVNREEMEADLNPTMPDNNEANANVLDDQKISLMDMLSGKIVSVKIRDVFQPSIGPNIDGNEKAMSAQNMKDTFAANLNQNTDTPMGMDDLSRQIQILTRKKEQLIREIIRLLTNILVTPGDKQPKDKVKDEVAVVRIGGDNMVAGNVEAQSMAEMMDAGSGGGSSQSHGSMDMKSVDPQAMPSKSVEEQKKLFHQLHKRFEERRERVIVETIPQTLIKIF